MANKKFEASAQLNDEYDTVVYSKGKSKQYYNPDTKQYRVFDNKSYTKVWNDIDYYDLVSGNDKLACAVLILLSNVNYDSTITRKDKHTRKRLPVGSKKELAELLHINITGGYGKKKLQELFDLSILFEAEITINKTLTLRRYYLNPLIGMRNKGISLDCYLHFRDIIVDKLPNRAIDNLDRHVLEEFNTIDVVDEDGLFTGQIES